MNNLEQKLQNLKKVQPGEAYSNRSLSMIVMSPRNGKRSWFSFTILHVAEYGTAVALVGLLFFMMLGNSSLIEVLSPIRSGSLNSGGLRAEAEAIDIQIKLLGVDYTESSSSLSTSPVTTPVLKKKTPRPVTISAINSSSSTSTPTSSPAIEDILHLLSQ